MRKLMAVILFVTFAATPAYSATTSRPKWGCFKVTAKGLNIRKRPYSFSKVIGTASRGDILIKRKRWCTPRGFWCAVTTEGGLRGYADKSYINKVPCPARLSQ